MYFYIGSKIPVRLDNSPKKVASDASSPATATTTTTTTTAPSTSSETSKKLNGGGSSTESPETNSKSDKKVTTTTSPKKSSKPWLSPKMFRAKKESRSKSVDHPKAGIKPVQTTGRKNDFLMEEDDVGETTASSTSDSEVVVVVNDVGQLFDGYRFQQFLPLNFGTVALADVVVADAKVHSDEHRKLDVFDALATSQNDVLMPLVLAVVQQVDVAFETSLAECIVVVVTEFFVNGFFRLKGRNRG